jgi:hypothetical protein
MFDNDDNHRRPPGTWQREKGRSIDGKHIIESSHGYVRMADGSITEIDLEHEMVFADGLVRPKSAKVGVSWSGLDVPQDKLYSCLNPFGHHEYRPVFLDVDGFATDLGNVLCTECLEANGKRKALKALTLGIYNPEEF